MKERRLGKAFMILGLLLAATPLILFLVIPLLSLLILSVTDQPFALLDYLFKLRLGQLVKDIAANFTLDFYANFFDMPLMAKSLRNTMVLGFWVTLVATIMGTVLAFAVTRTQMPGRKLVRALTIIPLVVPPFIGGYAFTFLMGDNGMLAALSRALGGSGRMMDLYSPLGIALVQIFFFFPLVFLSVSAALENIDNTLEEAAATQGAPRWYAILTTTLPMAFPGIASGALLVFIDSIGDYGTFGLLAPKGFPLIAVEAYKELSGYFHWGASAMLSMVMVVMAVAVLVLQKVWLERGHFVSVTGKRGALKPLGGRATGWVMLVVSLLFLLPSLLGMMAMIFMAFTKAWGTGAFPEVYTLENFRRAFITSPEPIKNSLVLSCAATAIGVVYALVITYIEKRTRVRGRKLLDTTAMLPLVIPGTAIAVAFIVTFNKPPLRLHNTVWILIAAYTIRRMPYAVRSLSAAFEQLDPSLDEAAMTMGASRPYTIWTVIAPLLTPGLIAGAMMVFINAIKEVSTSIMLSPASWTPLSAHIYRGLQEQYVFQAAAYAVVLVLLVLILQLLADRYTGRTSNK